jgi:GWxTD domain-containing protein
VNGFVRVPYRMVSGVTGTASVGVYRVELQVTDQNGTVLTRDSWTRRVPWATRRLAGSESVEPFSFAVAPGTYDVQVAVQDSGSAVRATVDLPVTAFESRPGASDLMLAYGLRSASAGDTIPGASEVRKGTLFIAAAPDLTLTPQQSMLSYYCEVYRDSSGVVPWLLRVIGHDGRVIVSTTATQTAVGLGGGRVAASIDLSGLPPGTYAIALVLGTGTDTLTRTATFRMSGFETERALELAAAEGVSAEVQDVFSEATEAHLDSLFEPLVYIAEQGELTVYHGLTVEGKQRFLRTFWRRRDPTPGTPANEAQDGFYRRIAEANRRFREGGAADVPGWRTDRGRVFIRYGEADDARREPQGGDDLPWEAWKYTRNRALKFVFVDMTRLGHYALVYSNDRLERSPEDWTQILSAEAITEITSF